MGYEKYIYDKKVFQHKMHNNENAFYIVVKV